MQPSVPLITAESLVFVYHRRSRTSMQAPLRTPTNFWPCDETQVFHFHAASFSSSTVGRAVSGIRVSSTAGRGSAGDGGGGSSGACADGGGGSSGGGACCADGCSTALAVSATILDELVRVVHLLLISTFVKLRLEISSRPELRPN